MRSSSILAVAVTLVLAVGFVLSCQPSATGPSEEEMTAVADKVLRAWNEADTALVEEVFAAGYIRQGSGVDGELVGLDALEALIMAQHEGFPDWRLTYDEVLPAQGTLTLRWTVTGTNQGSYQGQPPTGKPVSVEGLSLVKVVEGQVTDEWAYYDTLDVWLQMGYSLVPPEMEVAEE